MGSGDTAVDVLRKRTGDPELVSIGWREERSGPGVGAAQPGALGHGCPQPVLWLRRLGFPLFPLLR